MNRRNFLRLSGSTITSLGLWNLLQPQQATAGNKATSKTSKPNILYITTDQQFADAMSCAGNQELKTPAMGSIAQNGVLFDKAYCSQPLCCPSRTSMMTGRWPHETGVITNLDYYEKLNKLNVPFIGSVMTKAGYDCAYFGKWHLPVSPERKDLHGFETIQHTRFSIYDRDIPASCVDFINCKKRKKPFFMVASFVNPHDICQWTRGEELKNGTIPKAPPPNSCPQLPENFNIPENEPEILRKIRYFDHYAYPTVDWKPERWRQYRWAYYRLIELVDWYIGLVLDALRKSAQEENTLIIFASDHGDGHGCHQWNQKQVLYEESVRVPFIVSLKGVTKAGHTDRDHLVSSSLDLIPTICDYAGIKAPQALTGRSVRPLAEGKKPKNWRDFVVSETAFNGNRETDKLMIINGARIKGRMLRSKRYKYIVYSVGDIREQLFDMEKDPGETTSLVKSSEHKAVLEQHRKQLADWCKENGDSFVIADNT